MNTIWKPMPNPASTTATSAAAMPQFGALTSRDTADGARRTPMASHKRNVLPVTERPNISCTI